MNDNGTSVGLPTVLSRYSKGMLRHATLNFFSRHTILLPKASFRIIVTYDIGPGAYSLFLFEFKTFKVGALGYLKQSVSVIASTFPLVE